MLRKIVFSASLLLPMVATADTVVMRDGRTYDGTFISGNARQITLVDGSGVRKQMQVSDIQELRFGTAPNGGYRNGPRNRNVDNGSVFGSNTNTSNVDEAGLLAHIREDIRTAMYNSNLTSDQRTMFEDARRVLDRASNDFRNGYTVNYRDVRSALLNVRDAMNSGTFNAQDREMLMRDFEQLRAMRADYYGNDRNNR